MTPSFSDQPLQFGVGQRCQIACVLRQHRTDARMRVLHIEHRILVVGLQRQIDVEDKLRVGLAAAEEKAHGIAAGPVDQVAQRDVAAGALGNPATRG